jgi:drug/metabolite transporter (DMT)-like permease
MTELETSSRRLLSTAEGTSAHAFTARDWLLFLGVGAIWGSSFFFIAIGLESFAPQVITPLRLIFGFLALSLFPAARRRVDRADWPRIAALGVLWMAIPLSMFPFAEERVTSALTGMLNGANPIFTAAFAWMMLKRPPAPNQRWGLALGFAGTALIALPSLGEGRSEAFGVLLIFIALVCYGVVLNMAVPLQQKYGSLPVFWRAQMVAMAITIPFGLTGLGESRFELVPVLAILALGVLGTGVAYILIGGLAGRVGATRASISTYLIPVVAILLGVIVLSENVHPISLAGSALVLIGAWMGSRRGH